ncbi:MAG: N-acetylmuramoyl-L-alanine amidase [Bacteroidota bacterium]
MIKTVLFSLTLCLSLLPPLPLWFNLSLGNTILAPAEPAIPAFPHVHTRACAHQHGATSIPFGAAMGKVIKESGNDYKIKTVVLDAGHGGKDPGCSGANSREKHLALAVAKALQLQLQNAYPDLNIIMTRERDEFIPLHTRAAIANRNNADLFISIHCNYIPRYTGTKGTETYVMGLHKAEENLNVAKRENAAILYEENYEKTYDGFDPDSDEGHIILSMYQSAFLEQSILFASLVEDKFATAAKRKSRGVKQAGFLVLRETTMPSVLVETGFLSNRAEEAFLKSKTGQQNIANSIFQAFRIYKNTLEDGEISPTVANLKTPMPDTRSADLDQQQPAKPTTPKANLPTRIESTPTETQSGKIERSKPPYGYAQTEEKPLETPTNYDTPSPSKNTRSDNTTTNSYGAPTSTNQTTTSDSPIYYRVQLAASKTRLDTREDRWYDLPYIVEVIWENDMHKYQIRNIQSFQDADRIRIEMLHKGFMGAFIIAFQDGRRLSNKELSRME